MYLLGRAPVPGCLLREPLTEDGQWKAIDAGMIVGHGEDAVTVDHGTHTNTHTASEGQALLILAPPMTWN